MTRGVNSPPTSLPSVGKADHWLHRPNPSCPDVGNCGVIPLDLRHNHDPCQSSDCTRFCLSQTEAGCCLKFPRPHSICTGLAPTQHGLPHSASPGLAATPQCAAHLSTLTTAAGASASTPFTGRGPSTMSPGC